LIAAITFDDISPNYLSASSFQLILNILSRNNVQCTFFVVPGSPDSHSSFSPDFKSCLDGAMDLGHEIALHGYTHIANEFGYAVVGNYNLPLSFLPIPSLDNQKKILEQATASLTKLTGIRPVGFRAPFYLYNRQTLRVLANLHFRYDSTKTMFKPVHNARFRLKWLRNFKPHRVQSLMEIPVSGDYTFNLTSELLSNSLRNAMRDFEWIKSREGVFVVNIHPNQVDIGVLDSFLSTLIKRTRKGTDFHRLADLTRATGPWQIVSA